MRGQLEARHADANAALMTLPLWGTQRAVAQAGLISIAMNERIIPLLLTGGTRKEWDVALLAAVGLHPWPTGQGGLPVASDVVAQVEQLVNAALWAVDRGHVQRGPASQHLSDGVDLGRQFRQHRDVATGTAQRAQDLLPVPLDEARVG